MDPNMEDEDRDEIFPIGWFEDDPISLTYLPSYEHNNVDLPTDMMRLREPFFTIDSTLFVELKIDASIPLEMHEITKEKLQCRLDIINKRMGSMALCRGRNGDILRDAGALDSVLDLLYLIISFNLLPDISPCARGSTRRAACKCPKRFGDSGINDNHGGSDCNDYPSTITESDTCSKYVLGTLSVQVSIAALGALRDLSCGSSMNRNALGKQYHSLYDTKLTLCGEDVAPICGIHIISWFVERCHLLSWNEIIEMNELRLLTTAIATIRNVTHSAPQNSDILHRCCRMTDMLIWRLRCGAESRTYQCRTIHFLENTLLPPTFLGQNRSASLPDVTVPWREACFRIASSLINMAENNNDCVFGCASDDLIVMMLINAWNGESFDEKHDDKFTVRTSRSVPLLHIGLVNVLSEWLARRRNALDASDSCNDRFLLIVENILRQEEKRKRVAQLRELSKRGQGGGKKA